MTDFHSLYFSPDTHLRFEPQNFNVLAQLVLTLKLSNLNLRLIDMITHYIKVTFSNNDEVKRYKNGLS
jgi:hypothetical protein